MKIWLLTIGEPIIKQKQKLRLHRTGIFAKYISQNSDHHVTWFTSTFNHFLKKHEYDSDHIYNDNDNLKVISFKGRGYKSNISFSRIIDHYQIAKKFKRYIKKKSKPDIIITSFPTMELSRVAVDYARKNNICVLVDYRDLWPEVFVEVAPRIFQPIIRLILYPLFKKRKSILRNSTGIISITDELLNYFLKIINRKKNNFDNSFPLAYYKSEKNKTNNSAKSFWNKIIPAGYKNIICFFGTIGYQFDLETVIESAEKLQKSNVLFVICGDGDLRNDIIKKSKKLRNIIFPGYVTATQIKELLNISSIGLCPYKPKKAFLNSIPGKAIEYFSSGLPILTTLGGGVLGNLVIKNNFGSNYKYKNSKSLVDEIHNLLIKLNDNSIDKNKILKYYNHHFDSKSVFKNYLLHVEKVYLKYYKK